MKIKEGFVIEKVGGQYLAVAVGERADTFNALIRMNATGAYIWDKLSEGDKTHEQMLELMASEYDAPRELLEKDLLAFEKMLAEAGLLDE